MNEPLCSINVAYPHLKKHIKRLTASPGQNQEPVLPPWFVRWVSEPEDVRNSPLKQATNLFRNGAHRYLSRLVWRYDLLPAEVSGHIMSQWQELCLLPRDFVMHSSHCVTEGQDSKRELKRNFYLLSTRKST